MVPTGLLGRAGPKSVIHVVLTVPLLAVADAGLLRKCPNNISTAEEINSAMFPKIDREHRIKDGSKS
jgi:hypothetical protein